MSPLNLILFESAELSRPLPRTDARATHLLDVLRRAPGDSFDAGVVNGPRGKGTVVAVTPQDLQLAFTWNEPVGPAEPLTLIIGLPRPQTARDILRDATTLGAGILHFVATEKSEPSYAQSSLWSSGEWRRHLLAGAAQAFDTRVPEVTHGRDLGEVLADLPSASQRIALDNYEAPSAWVAPADSWLHPLILAIGPERGWAMQDRTKLRAAGFALVHLGTRVLRTETAVLAALTLARAARGWA